MKDQQSQQEPVLAHPTIGTIRGIKRLPNVIQYLGVQYAALQDRFSRGRLLESYPSDHARIQDGAHDATRIGPIPLSPLAGCQWEHSLIQHALPSPEFEQSDIECLTLNLAVPDVEQEGTRTWPVLALVHGGAFATGSSSYPQYDLGHIVQRSVEMGQPVIAVGINYRLGVPGFLHSSAMEAAGYKPNNGLDDQRLGLLWIKQHISGFNGDAERVTFIGESSGAASGTFHLHSSEPLFHQLFSMSGSSLVKAKPLEAAERTFRLAAGFLGASDKTEREQVKALLEASKDDIRDKIGRKVPLGPVVDGHMIPRVTTYSAMADPAEVAKLFPGMKHCRRVMFGDCQMDGSAYGPRFLLRRDMLPKTLATNLAASLDPIDPTLAQSIISSYELDTSTTSNTPESMKPVLDLATDICFSLGARAFASAWSESDVPNTEAFLARFNVPNPWDGPFKGQASHILDIAFALQNYREFLPAPGQRDAADLLTGHIVEFVNGGSPWPAYNKSGAMVYYAPAEDGAQDQSGYVPNEEGERTGRRQILQQLMKQEVFDRVMEAWEATMKGPPAP
ncbi:putative carboxylesterase [Rhypophila decipiens]|uniref:Carboxylesterase n=1 Tax=Rhypophila decipiens TaxID=261697 RepID=A0AAN6XV18_9PEZI|nr:putative carboxylesterase [Rhypophila decipiens]